MLIVVLKSYGWIIVSVALLASCSACMIGRVDNPTRESPPRLIRVDGGAE